MSLALYVHWPFCKSKCPYCDFNSHVRAGVDAQRWQAALLAELRSMAAWTPDRQLSSIFFGGGTPSLMPPQIVEAVIDEAARLFHLDAQIEITLEANPTSAEANNFACFQQAGVNRLSLGVQSLREDSLSFLGREHSAKEALQAVALAQKLFARTSFDLIYALPDQTAAAWEQELQEALRYAGEHLSLYQLTIEPNTAFYHAYYEKGRFELPEDTLSEELYRLTQQCMQAAGMPAYEISNHARIGAESRHNLTYWRGQAYLGVGAGAHGRLRSSALLSWLGSTPEEEQLAAAMLPPDGLRWVATSTHKSPERWLERVEKDAHALEICRVLSAKERAQEQLLTGLRLREGLVLTPEIIAQLDAAKCAFYEAQGFLVQGKDRLYATEQGWLVLNALLAEILIA